MFARGKKICGVDPTGRNGAHTQHHRQLDIARPYLVIMQYRTLIIRVGCGRFRRNASRTYFDIASLLSLPPDNALA